MADRRGRLLSEGPKARHSRVAQQAAGVAEQDALSIAITLAGVKGEAPCCFGPEELMLV